MSWATAWSEGAGCEAQLDLDGLAAAGSFLFGLCRMTVDADLAGFDEELDAGAADVGEGLGQVLVEAKELAAAEVGGKGATWLRRRLLLVHDPNWTGWDRGWSGLVDAAGGCGTRERTRCGGAGPWGACF